MKEIKAIVKQAMSQAVIDALHGLPHFPGLTLSACHGQGRGKGQGGAWQATDDVLQAPQYVRLEVYCSNGQVDEIDSTLRSAAHTGLPGDGIIMVVDLPRVVRIRTGEEGDQAL